ncbi:MAG TPA: efflux RND transporter periplasmic adaptor subunit [Anaerolineales bacterium]
MRRVIWIVIILGLLAGGWFAFTRFQEQRRAAAISGLQTVAVERGSLTATIGATGVVRANQTAILTWQTTGLVENVRVSAGDLVAEDEVLAILKETSLPQNIILAGVELYNAQTALNDLLEPASALSLTQAEQAIARAQENLRDAERRLNNLQSASPQTDIDQARANLVLAENNLERARQDFEPYANKPEDNLIRATLQSKLSQVQKDYDAAASLLNNLLGTSNPIDLSVAESNYAVAQAQLEDAQDQYEKLLAGPDADDIAAAEARIAAAQATVDLRQIAAPFPGTITEVHSKPGDQVAPGSVAFRLDDLSRLLVDVQLSEVDINRLQIGQNVNLTFDAILTQEYHGVVHEVAMVGSSVEGVVDFKVTVELTDADEAVRPGMTAAVNVIVEQLEDVALVPNRAVRLRDGERVVYVLRSEFPEPVPVTLGASSELYSQLLQGDLDIGDQIVLNPPTEFDQQGPPPFVER